MLTAAVVFFKLLYVYRKGWAEVKGCNFALITTAYSLKR